MVNVNLEKALEKLNILRHSERELILKESSKLLSKICCQEGMFWLYYRLVYDIYDISPCKARV